MRMTLIQLVEFLAGTDIEAAVKEAKRYAIENNCIVRFDFNGVEMNVSGLSDEKEHIDYYYKRVYVDRNKSD